MPWTNHTPCCPCCVCLLMIRSQCNDCRELDLCRDPALQAGSWACPCCGAGYDAAGIEARLVAALQSRIRDYALQDLVCKQCKQVGRGSGLGLQGCCMLLDAVTAACHVVS